MTKGTDATIIGAIVGAIVGVAPRVFDRITGYKHDEADTVSLVSAGAGSVTAAALAVLDAVQEERDTCRTDLAAANARIDHLEDRISRLHPPHQ